MTIRRLTSGLSQAHRTLHRLIQCEQGLTVTEYAVAAGLIAASLTATFFALGTTIDAIILAVTAAM